MNTPSSSPSSKKAEGRGGLRGCNPLWDMTIERLEEPVYTSDETYNRCPYMPHGPSRFLLAGPSESGKTTVCLNMVRKWLSFDEVYVYAKSLDQPMFDSLRADLSSSGIPNVFSESLDDLVDLDSLDNAHKKLIIFDDFAADKKLGKCCITDFYFRARHKNATIIMMSQSFFAVPTRIRDNTKGFILFDGCVKGRTALSRLAQALVNDIPEDIFCDMYTSATTGTGINFLYIDTKQPCPLMKYKNGFDMIRDPSDEEFYGAGRRGRRRPVKWVKFIPSLTPPLQIKKLDKQIESGRELRRLHQDSVLRNITERALRRKRQTAKKERVEIIREVIRGGPKIRAIESLIEELSETKKDGLSEMDKEQLRETFGRWTEKAIRKFSEDLEPEPKEPEPKEPPSPPPTLPPSFARAMRTYPGPRAEFVETRRGDEEWRLGALPFGFERRGDHPDAPASLYVMGSEILTTVGLIDSFFSGSTKELRSDEEQELYKKVMKEAGFDPSSYELPRSQASRLEEMRKKIGVGGLRSRGASVMGTHIINGMQLPLISMYKGAGGLVEDLRSYMNSYASGNKNEITLAFIKAISDKLLNLRAITNREHERLEANSQAR